MRRKSKLFAFGMKMISEVFQEGDIVPSSKKWFNKFSESSLYLADKAESIADLI